MNDPREPTSPEAVTRILLELQAGDPTAGDRLLPHIYDVLHEIAQRQMSGERPEHTLQPTVLVHEAFMRLVGQQAPWQNRAQFFSLAARVMRRLLVDHARRRRAQKRGRPVADSSAGIAEPELDVGRVDVELLDGALTRLAELDARLARVVELRFFAGLSVKETAEILETSPATVKRDWQFAKAWLKRELTEEP